MVKTTDKIKIFVKIVSFLVYIQRCKGIVAFQKKKKPLIIQSSLVTR